MSSFEVSSRHDPETWLKIWDSRVVVLNSKNRGAYGNTNCYYGLHEGDDLMVFLHRDGSGIYLATRFEGKIRQEGTGSRISGRFTRKKEAVIFLWFAVGMMLLGGISQLVMGGGLLRSLLFFAIAAICFAIQNYTPKKDVDMVKTLLTEISESEYHLEDEGDEFAGFVDNGDIYAEESGEGESSEGRQEIDEFADFQDDGDVFAEEAEDEKE
jgi:hypothetical protein